MVKKARRACCFWRDWRLQPIDHTKHIRIFLYACKLNKKVYLCALLYMKEGRFDMKVNRLERKDKKKSVTAAGGCCCCCCCVACCCWGNSGGQEPVKPVEAVPGPGVS